jgi:hypothetical protein
MITRIALVLGLGLALAGCKVAATLELGPAGAAQQETIYDAKPQAAGCHLDPCRL